MDPLSVVYVFTDTNFFLQLKPPQELRWDDVLENVETVILTVPRAVQKEIARLKGDGNSRRARHARSAAQLLMRAAQASNQEELVQVADPTVRISLPAPFVVPSKFADLKSGSVDDQIIAEILAFREAHPGSDVRLLSTDSDQVITCRHYGISFIIVPDDWLLPPEPDQRDKRLTAVEQRLTRMEKAEPQLTVQLENAKGQEITEFTLEMDDYPPLSANEILELLSEAQQRRPIEQGTSKSTSARSATDLLSASVMGTRFIPPTEEEHRRYREDQYPEWLSKVKDFLNNLHTRLNLPSRIGGLRVVLKNDSTRTAEGLLLTVHAKGGPLLAKPEIPDIAFPKPPEPPRGRYSTSAFGNLAPRSDSLWNIAALGAYREPRLPSELIQRSDPYDFYKAGGDDSEPNKTWKFECKQFRHGGHREVAEISLIIPAGEITPNPVVEIVVFAKNLSEPIIAHLPIRISYKEMDTVGTARAMLRKDLPSRLAVSRSDDITFTLKVNDPDPSG